MFEKTKLLLMGLMTMISVGFTGLASAALPAAVGTAFTELQTDGLALIDLAWPVVIALTVGAIIIGLFKKFARKAAG